MGKKYRSRKGNDKLFERIFIALIAIVVVAVIALVVVSVTTKDEGYIVTADGHVHDAQGNHVGDYDDMVADGSLVVTEDGHVHDAQGNHIEATDEVSEDGAQQESAEETPAGTDETAGE